LRRLRPHHSALDACLATAGPASNLPWVVAAAEVIAGAAPIQWAVAMADDYKANTTMLLEEGLDTGPILLQQEVEIGPEQTSVDLFEISGGTRGSTGGGDAGGSGRWENRNPGHRIIFAGVACADPSHGDDGGWILPPARRWNSKIAGADFQLWPGAFTALDGKKLIVHRIEVIERANLHLPEAAEPGQLFRGSTALDRLLRAGHRSEFP